MRYYLNGPTGGAAYRTVNYIAYADDLVRHLAYGWDGSYIYYFVDGVLIDRVASNSTIISYSDGTWEIGRLAVGSWVNEGKLTAIKISNTCRHTDTFSPSTPQRDANTIYLTLCTEGSGTTIAGSGPKQHLGTFAGAGTPHWDTLASLSINHKGASLWTDAVADIPNLSDDIWVKCQTTGTSAEFRWAWKVHGTGPYWAYKRMQRHTSSALFFNGTWTGVPEPAGDIPSGWSIWPSTAHEATAQSAHEYALSISPVSGSSAWFGSFHGNEVLVSEAWEVDGTPWIPTQGGYQSGSIITYTAVTRFQQGGLTNICDITRVVTLNKANNYIEVENTFNWNWECDPATLYFGMFDAEPDNLQAAYFDFGGTEYSITGSSSIAFEKSECYRLENVPGTLITACHIDDYDNALLRQAACQRTFIVQSQEKAYLTRSEEIDGIEDGDTWQIDYQYAHGDNL
jgi:hypothetical protein